MIVFYMWEITSSITLMPSSIAFAMPSDCCFDRACCEGFEQGKFVAWYRPFRYSAKEPGSSVIFIHFYTRDSIKWRYSFYHYCAHSKILQNVAKYRSIEILSQNS